MQNVETPTDIGILEAGLDTIKFLYRLDVSFGTQGVIELYRNSVNIAGINISSQCISDEDAKILLYNSLQSFICAHLIGMDEALDAAFKKSRIEKSEDDLRVVIYMLRCAYAHCISEPKWKIGNKKYRREIILAVPSHMQLLNKREFKFNFSVCDGQNVKNSDIGGLSGILMLTNMVIEKIKSVKLAS